MQALIAYFPFILLLVMYLVVGVLNAVFIKLSARILRGAVVSWRHALSFALGIAVLTLLGRVLLYSGSVPAPVFSVFGVVIYLILGAWYFSTRGTTHQGQPLGWVGALQLSALALLLFVVTGVVITEIVRIVAGVVQS